jgi:Cu(I)/Ag(I) efflux system membrane fusion protein
VLSGLREGERVVVKGNFKIDSALQIQAKPSMMNPAGYYGETDTALTTQRRVSDGSVEMLKKALPYYLAASKFLSEDDPHVAAVNLEKFKIEIDKAIANNQLAGQTEGLAVEMRLLSEQLQTIDHDLDPLRKQFGDVSNVIRDILEKYEYKEDLTLYLTFCPMAFENKGAYWLADSPEVRNPYFGAKMLTCGEVRAEYGRIIERSAPLEGHAGH